MRANAYDMVINGVEVGGGSIRIFNKELQQKCLKFWDLVRRKLRQQFGFLMNAFEYGAPPHGGIAYGLDRLCSIFRRADSIRDFIAFPKITQEGDVMIDSPAALADAQLTELQLSLKNPEIHWLF